VPGAGCVEGDGRHGFVALRLAAADFATDNKYKLAMNDSGWLGAGVLMLSL
jgi:hypothetical protein